MTCIGIETLDGTDYYADKVVLAAGAWSPALVDLEDQCVSKVRLSPWSQLISRHGCMRICNYLQKRRRSIKTRR
jgi:hypothetical protein